MALFSASIGIFQAPIARLEPDARLSTVHEACEMRISCRLSFRQLPEREAAPASRCQGRWPPVRFSHRRAPSGAKESTAREIMRRLSGSLGALRHVDFINDGGIGCCLSRHDYSATAQSRGRRFAARCFRPTNIGGRRLLTGNFLIQRVSRYSRHVALRVVTHAVSIMRAQIAEKKPISGVLPIAADAPGISVPQAFRRLAFYDFGCAGCRLFRRLRLAACSVPIYLLHRASRHTS